MTERFELRFEWLDAPGVREEALARTFARFEVCVGEACITRAFDARTRTLVEGANIALLPIAVWAVDNFWLACFEGLHGGKIRSLHQAHTPEERRWHRRHGWLGARDGFALPELVFSRGDAGAVRVDWFAQPGSQAIPLRFLEQGSDLVPRDIVHTELGRLVDGTLARCEGVESPDLRSLRERWELIQDGTPSERLVCERAARLGLDAYDAGEVDDALAELLAESVAVQEPLLDDLLDVAEVPSADVLHRQIERFGALLRKAETRAGGVAPWLPYARVAMRNVPQGQPYEMGYERAKRLRSEVLGLENDGVADALDAEVEAQLLPIGSVHEDAEAFAFSGVQSLVTSKDAAPFVVTRPRRLTALRFDRARALYTLLSMDEPRLVTAGFDADQQASRAFAAELLAPAEYLRSRVHSRYVDQERLQQLANALKVDAQLVRHQIENHELAAIVEG